MFCASFQGLEDQAFNIVKARSSRRENQAQKIKSRGSREDTE